MLLRREYDWRYPCQDIRYECLDSALHPGGVILSDIQQIVLENLELFYLRVPRCRAQHSYLLAVGVNSAAEHDVEGHRCEDHRHYQTPQKQRLERWITVIMPYTTGLSAKHCM